MSATVLMYCLSVQKEAALRELGEKLSLRMISVPASRHGCTIAQVLRHEGGECAAKPPLREEMLVMDLPGVLLDFFLQGMRQAGVDVPLKAVLTPTNVSWTAAALQQELQRERQEFLRRNMK